MKVYLAPELVTSSGKAGEYTPSSMLESVVSGVISGVACGAAGAIVTVKSTPPPPPQTIIIIGSIVGDALPGPAVPG